MSGVVALRNICTRLIIYYQRFIRLTVSMGESHQLTISQFLLLLI